jgi:glutathione S-transferase
MKGEHKQPAFLTKQPFGQIPVLEHGDITLFESRAIARYIVSNFAGQGTPLEGSDAKTKALALTWMEVETNNYNPLVSSIVYQKVFSSFFGQTCDDAVVEEQLKKLEKVLDVYEAHLKKHPYLAGNEFTLADLSHLPYTAMMFSAGLSAPYTSRPAVNAWWERISARESWKKVIGSTQANTC